MAALLGLDYLKLSIGLSTTVTTEDARLTIIIDQVSAVVRRYLKRDIISTSYPGAATDGDGDSGFYNGNGRRILRLRQRPITAVSAVYLDADGYFAASADPFPAETLLVYGTDYTIHWDGCLPGTTTKCSLKGWIERINGVWPGRRSYPQANLTTQAISGIGNIKVAYTAGYSSVPVDIQAACAQIAAYIRRNADKGGPMQSESLGAYSYSMASTALTGVYPELGSVRGMLAPWKEVVFA